MSAAPVDPIDATIADLFASGYGIDFITERGVYGGWSRLDAMRVASARGWKLDKSGRVPLKDRPSAPTRKPAREFRPGKVLDEPAPPRVVHPTPIPATSLVPELPPPLEAVAQWAERPDDEPPVLSVHVKGGITADEFLAADGPGRLAELTEKLVGAGVVTADEPTCCHYADFGVGHAPDCANARPPAPDFLARGLEHPNPRVRKLAQRAQAAVDDLVTALLRRPA